jgi:hypothetical protein
MRLLAYFLLLRGGMQNLAHFSLQGHSNEHFMGL